MSNGSFYFEDFAHFTSAFGEQCIPACYLLPCRRIRENVSYRDSSAIRETFLTNFCTNLIDCFDMFLLHSDRQTSTFFQWTTDQPRPRCYHVQGSAREWTVQIQAKNPRKRASMGVCGPAAQQHSSADIQGNHQIRAWPIFVAIDKICTQIKNWRRKLLASRWSSPS